MVESKNLCFDTTKAYVEQTLGNELLKFKGIGKHTVTIKLPICDDSLVPIKIKEFLLQTWGGISTVEYDYATNSLIITAYTYNPY